MFATELNSVSLPLQSEVYQLEGKHILSDGHRGKWIVICIKHPCR